VQRRITQLVGSLAFSVLTSLLVVLALFASPVNAATGPDAAGNGGTITHEISKNHPAVGAAFSAEVTGIHYVYVNNGSAPNSVSGYKLASGGLTPLPGSPYATGGTGSGSGYGGNQIAISPNHKCVFASDDGSGTFNSFKINANGSLTLVTHATVEGSNVQAIAVSPLGGVVFVDAFVSYTSAPLDSFSISSGCAITEAQSSNTNSAAGGLAVSKDGTQLFASSYIGGFINAYSISGTSFTLLHSNTANPSAPGGLAVAGKHLYSGNASSNSETGAYLINASGTLTSLPGSPATDSQGSNSAQVWFDHTDKQLVCSEQNSGSFGLFDITSGTYTFLAHANGAAGTPTAMAQVGHNLIVTNDGGGSISVYKIAHGSMTFKTTISLPASGSPNGIAAF
jgi:6-phosphogluconolactonase (cycloisomerase 2 family)